MNNKTDMCKLNNQKEQQGLWRIIILFFILCVIITGFGIHFDIKRESLYSEILNATICEDTIFVRPKVECCFLTQENAENAEFGQSPGCHDAGGRNSLCQIPYVGP